MPKPSQPKRLRLSKQPTRMWRYISMANDYGFLGGIIKMVPASGITRVPAGIPTGDGFDVEETLLSESEMKQHVPEDLRNRLLTGEEIEEHLQ